MQRAQEAGCFTWRWADKVRGCTGNKSKSKSKEKGGGGGRDRRGEEEKRDPKMMVN